MFLPFAGNILHSAYIGYIPFPKSIINVGGQKYLNLQISTGFMLNSVSGNAEVEKMPAQDPEQA